MTRSWSIIRQLALVIEKTRLPAVLPAVEDDFFETSHQLDLMRDLGLIARGTWQEEIAYRLTSAGHDFLEMFRDDGLWAEVQQQLAAGGMATLAGLQYAGQDVLRRRAIAAARPPMADVRGSA